MKIGDRFHLTPVGSYLDLDEQDVVVTHQPIFMGSVFGTMVVATGKRDRFSVCLFSDGDVRSGGQCVGHATPIPVAPIPAAPRPPPTHAEVSLDDWRRKIAALRGEPAPSRRPATAPPGSEAARAMRLALRGHG